MFATVTKQNDDREEFKQSARNWRMDMDDVHHMLCSAFLQAVIDARDLHVERCLRFSNGYSEEFRTREINKLEYYLGTDRAEFWTAMIGLDADMVEREVMDICHGRKIPNL